MTDETVHALYFNGLTDGHLRQREQFAMHYLAKRGIEVMPTQVNWRSDESFDKLLARLTKLAETELENHGQLLLIGTSAGGSLALNVFHTLKHRKDVMVVTLCARLHEARLPWWDHRTMERMAYVGTPKASKKFVDSVEYCTHTTIPNLSETDEKQIVIVKQWMDDVVPRSTMGIPGVRTTTVPAIGHGWGMAMGVRRLPKISKSLLQF